ncbi:MAG: hypothetical protein ABIR30_01360 [Chitinophagaceae bacterium]
MKFLLLSLFAFTLFTAGDCGNKKAIAEKYKGKLEIAALCMNYTIALTEGKMDTAIIAAAWTDESTKKTYVNVFRLGNPCNFPAGIKQGDEFYFTIDSSEQKLCAVCMAYYPTPPKAISIKVVEQ